MQLITKQSPKTEYDRRIKEVEAKRNGQTPETQLNAEETGIISKTDRLPERLTK